MTGSLRSVLIKLGLFTAITLSLTGLLAAVIGNVQPFTSFYRVNVEFSDVTGLLKTDVVKVAGVTVGKVSGSKVEIDPKTGEAHALVTLKLRKFVDIPRSAHVAVKFRNLLGQRMVVITRNEREPQTPLLPKDGNGRIPLMQTSPAFDLGIVFNNLKPVLSTLSADDVNTLSRALLQIFSGREARVHQMISDLADITETLGSRGAVVTDLVTNLGGVAKTVAAHDKQLGDVIDHLDTIVHTLGNKGAEFARAADNLGIASQGTADVISNNRPALDSTIAQLRTLLDIVDRNREELDAALIGLPKSTHALSRATTYGHWVNLNLVCVQTICGSGFHSAAATAAAAPDPKALASFLLELTR